MRDLITVVCFVVLMVGVGMADRFYHKWKIYVACSQINLLIAEGKLDRTLDFIRSHSSILEADSIDDALNVCHDEEI